MTVYILFGLLVCTLVVDAQSPCQDVDSQTCQVMFSKNSDMCQDATLSTTACPRFCNKCPLTCYHCDTDIQSPADCKTTKTCAVGESCLTQTNQSSDGTTTFTLGCASQAVCTGTGEMELIGKRDAFISCCSGDFCNGPAIVTMPTTTVTTPTTRATTAIPTATVTIQPPVMTTTDRYSCARDLIFIVDESTSMALVFPTIKRFLTELVSKLTIGPSHTMVSMATFALLAHKRWDLNRYPDKQQLIDAIDGLKPNIALNSDGIAGLGFVIDHAVQSRYGDRPNVPDDVIFISDGTWHKNLLSFLTGSDDQHAVVEELHRDSNNVISIGIGPADPNMIYSVATDTAHTFKVQNAIELLSIETQILNLICK